MQRYENHDIVAHRISIMLTLYGQTDKLAYLARDEIRRRARDAQAVSDWQVATALWMSNPMRWLLPLPKLPTFSK